MSIYRDRQDFWSRRRAAVEREEQKALAQEMAAFQQAERAAMEEKPDHEILAELDLPDPETLKAGDDFSAFMAHAVPDRIRRRALRVLWRANPVLANLDELLDYGEDFTDGAMVVENLQTAYQVGKGMLHHVEEMVRQADSQDEDPVVHATQGLDVGTQEPLEDLNPGAALEQPEPLDMPDMDQPETVEAFVAVPTPRRMRFRTEEPA